MDTKALYEKFKKHIDAMDDDAIRDSINYAVKEAEELGIVVTPGTGKLFVDGKETNWHDAFFNFLGAVPKIRVIDWIECDEGNLPEVPDDLYNDAYDAVVKEVRRNNYHFDGNYHQNGEYGCPVLEDDKGNQYQFFVTFRTWGAIMADAYPDEEYNCEEGFRYTKWAWHSPDPMVLPHN